MGQRFGPGILDLPEIVAALSGAARTRFERLFDVSGDTGRLVVPAAMRERVEGWYGGPVAGAGLARAETQRVTRVSNRRSYEETLFNPLRASRPVGRRGFDDLEERIAAARQGCDFCEPEERTTSDTWGRIAGSHCVTGANVAKYDAHHGLVIFREHHPLRFGVAEASDYLDVAMRWLERTAADAPELRFPLIAWNCLWSSGASQVHGHLHAVVNRRGPYGRQARVERAAARYRADTGIDYWDDWVAAHDDVGLAVATSGVTLVASMTPSKGREVAVVGRRFDGSFAAGLASALRTLIDDLGVLSFNCAVHLPPLGSDGEQRVVGYCVDRGDPARPAGGVGAMEMYGAPVVASDPFEVAAALAAHPG